MNGNKEKTHGAVYTPLHIVKTMLDLVGYVDHILERHIIDNSCGEGAFLIEIVERYCTNFLTSSKDLSVLKQHLETYIHGLDNDACAIKNCISNLDTVAKRFNLDNIHWDIKIADTLEVSQYDNKMDYVVGNPPYVRVHNLKNSYSKVKKFTFANNGMTDLYIVFFEIGFRMLSPKGKMCLITPSSFLRSKAGATLRKYIYQKQCLVSAVDLGHYQPFEATTYTIITVFDVSKKSSSVGYYRYDENLLAPKRIETLKIDDIFINGNIYFSKSENIELLRRIENHFSKRYERPSIVKNGFATLSDDIFIGQFDFQYCLIDVLKASTGKWYKCIFPYTSEGIPLTEEELRTYPDVYDYLLAHKAKLCKRDIENQNQWFLFGRSQAIKDVFANKIAINTTIKGLDSIRIELVPPGKGVFSGLYILTQHSIEEVKSAIINQEFIDYLKLLKNYKSGGYYSFSAIELEKFLSYKLEEYKYEQLRLFRESKDILYNLPGDRT